MGPIGKYYLLLEATLKLPAMSARGWVLARRAILAEFIGNVMKSYIETAALITGCGSAAFWFASALCHLPGIKPGTNGQDTATELSNRLQRMSTWNFWAAGLMGVTALLSVWIRFLG